MGGGAVAKSVRGDHRNTGLIAEPHHHLAHHSRIDAGTTLADEQRGLPIAHYLVTHLEPRLQCPLSGHPERHHPLFIALTENPHYSCAGIDVACVGGAQLRDPDAAAVEDLNDRVIADGDG